MCVCLCDMYKYNSIQINIKRETKNPRLKAFHGNGKNDKEIVCISRIYIDDKV